jgi:hypothetical protein
MLSRDLAALVASPPADRTVYSDLPLLPGRAPYQTVLQETTDAPGIPRADFSAVFNGAGSTSSRGCPRT